MKEDIKIPLLFFIASIIWIYFTDKWLYTLELNKERELFLSNAKGYIFVIISSAILFLLIRYNNKRLLTEQASLRKQTERNEQLFDVLNKIENLVIITDSEGKITWVNKAMERHTGYLLTEIKGSYPGAVLRGPETSQREAKQIEDAVREKINCTVEILNYKKNGETYWASMHFAPLLNSKAEINAFLSIQSDITKHRLLEEKLSKQNDFLRKITWMTSHDIRRPLSSILSLVQLIKTGSAREAQECLTLLFRSAEELDEIIIEVNKKINGLDNYNPFS